MKFFFENKEDLIVALLAFVLVSANLILAISQLERKGILVPVAKTETKNNQH